MKRSDGERGRKGEGENGSKAIMLRISPFLLTQ
jgi:hypothetical protein